MTKKLLAWPIYLALRLWQLRALCDVSASRKDEALVVATPGAGKTLFALRLAHDLFSRGVVERVVVVVPSHHLKRQWHDAALLTGIDLDPSWANEDGQEATDYHGVIVTYAQVASQPELFRFNTRRPTLLIGDEWHHIADDLRWGEAMKVAFTFARFKLLLSGTAFRTDNNQLPWVEYVEGRSKADYEYGYARALADGVCRPIYFPSFDGRVRWQGRDGRCEERWLLEEVTPEKSRERLRAALDPSGQWMKAVLTCADEELTKMRAVGHHDAAGIIFAQDQEHARRIGELLGRLTGAEAVVAVSDDSESSRKISEFASGSARWIVAVRLISEGVDIPRLRVGVYATGVTSELFFRQVAGRLVRAVPGLEEQSALLFLPAVEELVRHALCIQQEREHVIKQEDASVRAQFPACGEQEETVAPSPFLPLASYAEAHDTIYAGSRFAKGELENAERVAKELGMRLPAPQVAALLRRGAAEVGVHTIYGAVGQVTDSVMIAEPEPEVTKSTVATLQSGLQPQTQNSLHDRKAERRAEINRLANKLAGLIGERPFRVHSEWKEKIGKAQRLATEEELEQKLCWLLARVNDAYAKRAAAKGVPLRQVRGEEYLT